MLLEMEINLVFPDRVGLLEKTKHLGLGLVLDHFHFLIMSVDCT